jgi:RNA polymerase sigma-70 factor (ECF subfamily)
MTAEEWAIIVRQHSPLVWRTVYRLLRHEGDASDCFQETFVSAWEVARRETVRNWGGLLQRLATTTALDQLRRRKRETGQVKVLSDGMDVASANCGPAESALAKESAEQLRQAIAELPERMSQAYCLRHLNGMSYQEIGEELGMPEGTVAATLHRAREKLREILTPMFEEGDRR